MEKYCFFTLFYLLGYIGPFGPIPNFLKKNDQTNLTRRIDLRLSGAFLLAYVAQNAVFIFSFSGFWGRGGPRRDGPGEEQGDGRGCPGEEWAGRREFQGEGSREGLPANFQPFGHLNFQPNKMYPD